jgi:hypothetical protein
MGYLAEQMFRAVIVLAGVLTVVRTADLPAKGGSHGTLARAGELPPERGSHKTFVVTPGVSNSLVSSGFGYFLVASGFSRKVSQNALRSVRVEPANQDGTTRVIIEGNGPLPDPGSGAPVKPPRIYLDFTDVLPPRDIEPVSPNPLVIRIRVAEHSASPLVTRVVLHVVKETPYRIDSSARAQGRIVVILGVAQSPSSKPASPPPGRAPSSSTQSGRVAGIPSTPSPQARTVSADTQYGLRVAAVFLRLYALKPLLGAIDRRADSVPGNLEAAAKEFDDLAKLLAGIKPPSSRASTHALLLRTCTLGARAARLRETAGASQDAASTWDAASAAAGALLMLDRANTDLSVK